MIELEKEFNSGAGGFSDNPLSYTQLKRNEKAAVYMRSRNGQPYDYEAFLIKIDKKGKTTKFPNGTVKVLEDDMEKYPSCSQFGRIAWSFCNISMAMLRFHELTHGEVKEELTDGKEIPDAEPISSPKKVIPVNTEKEKDEDPKPYKGPDLLIPVGEFSTKQLASHNNVQYPIAFLFRKEAERKGQIKFSRKQKADGRGKPTDIFVSI